MAVICVYLYTLLHVYHTHVKKILHIHYLTYKTTASSNVAKNKYMHTVLNITRWSHILLHMYVYIHCMLNSLKKNVPVHTCTVYTFFFQFSRQRNYNYYDLKRTNSTLKWCTSKYMRNAWYMYLNFVQEDIIYYQFNKWIFTIYIFNFAIYIQVHRQLAFA